MVREVIRKAAEHLAGDLPDEQELHLEVSPDMKLIISTETVGAGGEQRRFCGIRGRFVTRDGGGEMNIDPGTEFRLGGLEEMGEVDVSEIAAALVTLVKIGITPQDVADFMNGVFFRRVEELYRDNSGL